MVEINVVFIEKIKGETKMTSRRISGGLHDFVDGGGGGFDPISYEDWLERHSEVKERKEKERQAEEEMKKAEEERKKLEKETKKWLAKRRKSFLKKTLILAALLVITYLIIINIVNAGFW